MAQDILQALFFYPRGGSAQVIRYLSAALVGLGARCRIVSGSLGDPGDRTHAGTFFRDIPVEAVDYTDAVTAFEQGGNPLEQRIPLHPSYEDRLNAPDPVFTSIDPETAGYLEQRWMELLAERVPVVPELFHVHHLTPLQAAVRENWPRAPMIGHLHGTELKMLELASERLEIAEKLGLDLESDAHRVEQVARESGRVLSDDELAIVESTRWGYWRFATWWSERLRHYAHLCDRLIVLSEEAGDQAAEVLGVNRNFIHAVPNGVDVSRFYPARLSSEERQQRWRYWLVDEPQGWDESGVAGSVRYHAEDVDEWFADQNGERTPVLMFVGRFVGIKRVPLLIRAYKRAQPRFKYRAPLVIWGGNPGEWEDEHPVAVAREEEVSGVFFVGWRGHGELPYGLNAADVMVAPSTNEPFGQVYLEAMACGLPVIATLSGGPLSFVNTDDSAPNGWLVPPDDEAALAEALVEVVNSSDERRARGENAVKAVEHEYSWDSIALKFQEIYALAIEQEEEAQPTRAGGEGEG